MQPLGFWIGQEYSPRALFGGSQFISASTSQGKTILNGKDVDGDPSTCQFATEANYECRKVEICPI